MWNAKRISVLLASLVLGVLVTLQWSAGVSQPAGASDHVNRTIRQLELEQEELKRRLRREIEANTPAGRVAIESAKRLLNDRNLFLGKEYRSLVENHIDDDPMTLPTETVLLLFLSAVELKEQVEMDRWGQELKRRHRGTEVRDWVNETMSAAR